MKKTVLAILHEGFEEIELVCPVDLLSRAGVSVTLASRESSKLVKGRSGCVIQADVMLDEVLSKDYDLLFLPGGPGTPRMTADERILKLVVRQNEAKRWIGAICAAPSVLEKAGVLGKKDHYTAHPCTLDVLPHPQPGAPFVIERNIITSYGAGAAIQFGLQLVKALSGEAITHKVSDDIGWGKSLVC